MQNRWENPTNIVVGGGVWQNLQRFRDFLEAYFGMGGIFIHSIIFGIGEILESQLLVGFRVQEIILDFVSFIGLDEKFIENMEILLFLRPKNNPRFLE